MPVSKRDKKVSLTKTQKKGMKMKQDVVEKIRDNINKYNNLYAFCIFNMRNNILKEVREEWKDSRFFFAKKKVMAIALGRTPAEELEKNLHKLASQLKGQCGLLFTNREKDEVTKWYQKHSRNDFAKSGFIPTETIIMPAGPMPEFNFSMEPYLRGRGLPTKLEKGIIQLREDFVVCTKGVSLTPEAATILKLLGKQLAEFKITLLCRWSKDGSFEKFKVDRELLSLPKTNVETPKQKGKTSKQETKTASQQNKTPNQKTGTPKIKDPQTQEPEVKQDVAETLSQEPEMPICTTEKHRRKTSKKTTQTPKPMDIESDKPEVLDQVQESPEVEKTMPRRSMRTPKPIKRTPDQLKVSVKKLTESAKRLNVTSKAKGTPKDQLNDTPKKTKKTPKPQSTKKATVARPQNESEDVEMAE